MQFSSDLSQEFKGENAIVLGGSSGIGQGIAELLCRRGAKVTIIGLSDARKTATDFNARSVGKEEAFGVDGDASESAFMKDTIEKVISDDGGVHILVNSAAIVPLGNVIDTTPEEWDRCMNVNLRTMFLSCHYAAPDMVTRGSGSIVNIASVQGTATTAGVCAYTTTKGGILSFTRTLAVDLGPKGVRANSLSPGSIITPMQEYFADMTAKEGQTREDVYAQFAEPVPIGRLGDVVETAELACFLASKRSGFCNGGEYVADGGLLAGLRLY